MSTDYLLRTRKPKIVPQNEKLPGTNRNNAGGYSFRVDKWTRLRRFLILGSEGGTFYVSERKLTKENFKALESCLAEDGRRVVDEIVAISVAGRAPKQEPTMYALAAAASDGNVETRRYALSKLNEVCRTGTHLFLFINYVESMRGWGRGLRNAVANWYLQNPKLELTLAKYKQREGWSQRDILRLCKPRPERGSLTDQALAWAVGKGSGTDFLRAVDEVTQTTDAAHAAELVRLFRLPWEVVNSDLLRKPKVWEALIPSLGYTALVRNLGRLTSLEMLHGETLHTVLEILSNEEKIRKSRIHPVQLLNGMGTYFDGKGQKGSLNWTPMPSVVQALDSAFYTSFGNVEPTWKRHLLALDVSGSMAFRDIAGTSLTPREASAALALVTLVTEPDTRVMGFAKRFIPLNFTPGMRLHEAIRATADIPFGSTDCAQPMLYAMQNGLAVDTFVVYTDSETWAGNIHPKQALDQYRNRTGIDARLVVVGMEANKFSIADPDDPGMLDVVGFDTATPGLIADFSAGRV